MVPTYPVPAPQAGSRPLPTPPTPPKATTFKVDLQIVLLALRRHWRWAFFLGFLFATSGTVATCLLVKPKYQASATIQIRSQVPYVAFEPKYTEQEASKYFVQTQIELLRNPIVLEPTSRQPKIAAIIASRKQPDPVKWLSTGLSVQMVGNSELFTVSFTSTSPTDSETIVNAIIDQYFEIQKAGEATRNQHVIDLLAEESKRRQQEVLTMRGELKEFVDQATKDGTCLANLFSPTTTTSAMDPSGELLTRLTDAEVELEILEAQAQAEEKQATVASDVSRRELNEKIANDPEMKRLQTRLHYLRANLHETERLAVDGMKNPHCQTILAEIAQVESVVNRYEAQLAANLRDQLAEEVAHRHQDSFQKKHAALESHRMMVNLLRQRYAEQLSKLRKDSNGTLDIEFRRAELLRAESVLERISNRAVALRTEQHAPERVILRKRAQTPLHPVSSYPFKEMFLAIVLGFAMPIGLAVLIEAARPKVSGGESLLRNVHLNILGEVARLSDRQARTRERKSLRFNRNSLLFEESVDALRTNLFLSPWGQSKVFAITSAVSAEGKTSITTQLALSVSRMRNVKTLLIDCDLRIPELHEYFDLPLSPGLAEVLSGQITPEEATVETWLENLDVLPAGTLSANPHSLFTAESMKRVLDWAAPRYHYVILDTPPVLEASEALVAAKAADASILCAMQNVSRFDQVRKACERLTVVGSPPIGAVLSGVSCRRGKYSYHNYEFAKPHHAPNDITV